MSRKGTDISIQDHELATPVTGLAQRNGNGAGTSQVQAVVEQETALVSTRDLHSAKEHEEKEDQGSSSQTRVKSKIIIFSLVALLLAGAVIGARYWLHARQYESTDDAFIEGHATQISPKVSGYVQKVYIDDNQRVKAGDLLVEIDPRDYEARLAQARAQLRAATARNLAARAGVTLTRVTTGAGVEQATAGVDAARSSVDQARAASAVAQSRINQLSAGVGTAEAGAAQARSQVDAAVAEAVRTRTDAVRYKTLFEKDVVSRQQLDWAAAAATSAEAQLEAARKKAAAAQTQVDEARAAQRAAEDQYRQALSTISGTEAQVGQATGKLSEANSAPQQVAVKQSEVETAGAEIEQAEAALRQAELELSYTKIYAPEDGRITRKSVELGAFLQPGQALLVLVPSEMWVIANFKETQLKRMRPGQQVEITVDAFPDKTFRGQVDSLQSGTGSRFSLLPAENATGNYVKVVQRVPVKIVFDEHFDSEHLLAPGMSVEPEVKVR